VLANPLVHLFSLCLVYWSKLFSGFKHDMFRESFHNIYSHFLFGLLVLDCAMPDMIRSVAGIYLTVITLTGTTFNALVVIVLVKNISSITVPNIFILSICISGCLASCIAVPQALYSATAGSWDETSCQIHAFFIYIFGTVSMLTLGAVALEKYLTIVKYTYANGHFLSHKQAVVLVVGMWLFSFFLSVMPFAGWSTYGIDAATITCSLRWDQTKPSDVSYFVVMFLGCFVLPVSVMVFSYLKIFIVRTKVAQASTRYVEFN